MVGNKKLNTGYKNRNLNENQVLGWVSPFYSIFLFLLVTGCGSFVGSLNLEKNSNPKKKSEDVKPETAFFAKSISECINNQESCFTKETIPPLNHNLKLVRTAFNAKVFDEIGYSSIEPQYRKTLEAAAIAEVMRSTNRFFEFIQKIGLSPKVHIDPLCRHPGAIKNGFYKRDYGTSEDTAKHFICLGFSYAKDYGKVPLALDPAIIFHELFHVLFSEILFNEKEIPVIVFENHDLDSLNEGLADHFAILFGNPEFDPWITKNNDMNWRTAKARKNLRINQSFFAQVYKDGQRWTELANSLHNNGVDTIEAIVCSVNKTKKSLIELSTNENWNRVFNNSQLLKNFRECIQEPQKSQFNELARLLFSEQELADPIKEIELAVVAVTNQKAMCQFAKDNNLNASSFQIYQTFEPCLDFSTVTYKGNSLLLAKEEFMDTPYSKKDILWVTAGFKPLKGSQGVDCRLRGDTAFTSELGLGGDFGIEMLPFSISTPRLKKGSWYRDIAFGNSESNFKRNGSFEPFEKEGFQFIGANPTEANTNGYFLLATHGMEGDSRDARRTHLASYLKSTFGYFKRGPNLSRCMEGDECDLFQNYFLECRNPETLIPTRNVRVGIYDCEEGKECQLYTY